MRRVTKEERMKMVENVRSIANSVVIFGIIIFKVTPQMGL